MSNAKKLGIPETLLCVALAVLAGFQSIPYDAIWLSTFWSVAAIILSCFRNFRQITTLELGAWVAFSALFLTVAASQWPWVSFWTACSLSLIPIGFIIFLRNGRENFFRAFKISVLSIALANSAYTAYMSIFWMGRNGGLFADANMAANLSVIGVLVLTEFILLSGRKRNPGAWVAVAFLVFSIFVMQSRAAILIMSLSLLFVFFSVDRKYRAPVIAFLPILVVAYFLSDWVLSSQVSENINPFNRTESFGYRLDLWASSARLFAESPWFGSGLGTFSLLYPSVRELTEIGSVGFFVHNDFLQLLLELGLIPFLVVVTFPCIVCFKIFVSVFNGAVGERRVKGIMIILVLFVIASHALVNFIFYHPLFAFILGAFLGIGAVEFIKVKSIVFRKQWLNRTVYRFPLGLIFVLGTFSITSSVVDRLARETIAQSARTYIPPSLARDSYYTVLAYSYFSPLNTDISDYLVVSETNTAVSMEDMDLGHELAQNTISLINDQRSFKHPNCLQSTAKARLYWAIEEKERSVDVLRDILLEAPDCERARIVLAEALIWKGNSDQAIDVLNAGIDRIRFKEVLQSESRMLFEALEGALRSSGRIQEAEAVKLYIQLLN
ncbi:O-antigen ligase family protein [Marinobacter sp.]|uniref:O-antigen ligase family protein n=1 Tax=Marinobacter sp. TaxID=50741 RepID=UPI0035C6ACD2